jgi:hypothetical protein
MSKLVPILTLAIIVAYATLGAACPPEKAPTALSWTEIQDVCRIVGSIAHTSARMRDTGRPYLEAVQRMREISANHFTSGALGVWLKETILSDLHWIYEHPVFSAQQVQNYTEMACLRIADYDWSAPTPAAE